MNKYRYIFFILSLFLLSCSQQNKDKNLLEKENDISNLHKKASETSLDSSYFYLKKGAKIIHKDNLINNSLKAENYYLTGLYFKEKRELDSASSYFYKATTYVKDSITTYRQDYYFIEACKAFWSLDKIGDSFIISNNYLSIIDKNKDYSRMALAYYFKNNSYLKLKDYNNALKYSSLRIEMLKKAKDTLNLIPANISLAKIKFHHLNDTIGAYKIMDSLVNQKNIPIIKFRYQIFNQYGVFKFYEKDYYAAINYYKKGINLIIHSSNSSLHKNNLAYSYGNIAEAYLEIEKPKKAAIYLDSMTSIGFKNIDDIYLRSYMKYKLKLDYMTNNDISSITSYLDSIYDFQTNLYQKKINNELLALKEANANEKKLINEKQAVVVNNIRLQLNFYLLIGFILLLIISSIILYQYKVFKFEKQNLQMQQRLLRSQMNPHFMFNTLYSIQNLIDTDPKKSTLYLIKFSRLLRLILDNSLHNYVLLEDELDSLEKYIDLQLMRFPNKFRYKINLEKIEKGELLYIPPMLLQPFIENSIEHGFKNIDYVGNINIHLTLQEKFILCKIDDNGVGLNNYNITNKKSTSIKLITSYLEKSTKSKIKIINKKTQSNDKNGLFIEFLIPFKFSKND